MCYRIRIERKKRKAPPSIGFSRQDRNGKWSGLTFPSPEELSDPGIEPRSPALQADTLTSEPPGKTGFNQDVVKSTVRTIPEKSCQWETQN